MKYTGGGVRMTLTPRANAFTRRGRGAGAAVRLAMGGGVIVLQARRPLFFIRMTHTSIK